MVNERRDAPTTEQLIEQEVRRRVGRETRRLHDENGQLRSVIAECRDSLVQQNQLLNQLTAEPQQYGNLLQIHNEVDPNNFRPDDEIIVSDPQSPHYQKGGKIVSGNDGAPVIDEEGFLFVKLHDDSEVRLSVGINGQPTQVRLTNKSDGTSAVVSVDGKPWEVKNVPTGLNLAVGDSVKITGQTKQIVGPGFHFAAGPICDVVTVTNVGVEVLNKTEPRLLQNPRGIELEAGDRVIADAGLFLIVERLPKEEKSRYNVTGEINVTWDDVGGLDEAKQQLRDILELPFQRPDLFDYYGVKPTSGVLLYGPPGCGKTLLARVAAWAQAQQHGQQAMEEGYRYIKSPEMLDKWVGNTEADIRRQFEWGRHFFRQHGFKAVLAFDEIDAIAPARGSHVHRTVQDSIVPMFLGEMDPLDEDDKRANPLVFFMTNRSDTLDPALTRPGRISHHIKIDRPNEIMAVKILGIHAKMPLADEENRRGTLTITVADIFSKNRLLYRINNEHDFTMGDACSGAMLAQVAEEAKMLALHRDLDEGTTTGVKLDDLREAVERLYRRQRGINHAYDIQDFAEKKGLSSANLQVTRHCATS